MKRLNKKGFTLVELLAVIVVLALLMIVAARAIGNTMTESKERAIKAEAKKLVDQTYEDIQLYLVNGTDTITYKKTGSTATIAGSINQTSSKTIELQDSSYHMVITIPANATNAGSYCIDDGTSLKYTGTITNGITISEPAKATGTFSACA